NTKPARFDGSRPMEDTKIMTISLYKCSVPIFVQFLTSLSAVLDKAAGFAEAKKVEPAVLLNTRLAPDMFPLVRQGRAATDHPLNALGRPPGADIPRFANAGTTIPELQDPIAQTVPFLKNLQPPPIPPTHATPLQL